MNDNKHIHKQQPRRVNEGGVRFSEHSERIPNPTVYNHYIPERVESEILGLAKRIPKSSVYNLCITLYFFIL